LYFSPDRFTSNEIFIEMYQQDKITSANQFTYRLFVAGGLQDVGNHNHQSSLRYSASAGYKLKHNLYFNLEGKWSNVSSSNTSGQSYFQIAINIGYRFNKGPFDIMETK